MRSPQSRANPSIPCIVVMHIFVKLYCNPKILTY